MAHNFFCVASLALIALAVVSFAAPHNGEEHFFEQPDGSSVPARLFGDEFHIDAESPDGYTLTRGEDGWICYAELSADGSKYVSTGVRYTGLSRAPAAPRRGVRINTGAVRERRRRNRDVLGYDELIAPTEFSNSLSRLSRLSRQSSQLPRSQQTAQPAPASEVSRIVGLTLLIQFPDQPVSAITSAAMEEFCNRPGGYGGTSAAGSVYDYFYDVSDGLLEYTNIVTPFVVVDSARAFYDDGQEGYRRVPDLITHALRKLRDSGFDISGVTTEFTGSGATRREVVVALNIFYAGRSPQTWATGIWPHAGTYRAPTGQQAVTIDGVGFSRYQMSSLGTGSSPPGIGTFVHENGHLIMRWPDLYPYEDGIRNFVGGYCVMATSNGTNPQTPNPFFRDEAGWITVTDITGTSATLTHTANSHAAYKFTRNGNESYYMEARRSTGRSGALPGEGFLIWHVHKNGNNTNDSRGYPQVALIQANNGTGTPNASAPFRAGGGSRNTAFHSETLPAAVYHDGIRSNIHISEVSAAGNEMTFRIGGREGPASYYLAVVNGTGTGYYEEGEEVTITAPDTNAAGRAFMRWNGAELMPEDVYANATTVTMIGAEASVAALFARAFALPGQVEADTFGLAHGIVSASNQNGATGNRVARIVDTSKFAEYVVDIDSGGRYGLSYRLLTSSSSAGAFVIRDMTNGGVALDSVTVPTSSRSQLQVVAGKTVELRKGKAVWRLEPVAGNYSVDWFAAEFAGPPTPVVESASVMPAAYGIRALPSGCVVFQVPEAGRVEIKMYDMRGRIAGILFDGMMEPGVRRVSVPSSKRIGRGMYIIRMRSGGYSESVRIHYRR